MSELNKKLIRTVEHGPVLTLVIDRPLKRNALTLDMYSQMADVLDEVSKRDDIRALMIAGQKDVFCAGNDLNDFAEHKSDGGAALVPVMRFLKTLALFEKPIIAMVDGLAVGVGLTMLFHCDLVYCSQFAKFSGPFTDLGLVPEAGSTLAGPRIMGYQRAFALLVLGETFDAKQAHEALLVNKILDREHLEHEALRAAQILARKPQEAVKMSRELLKGNKKKIIERIEWEGKVFAERLHSEECQQAITKFLNRPTSVRI